MNVSQYTRNEQNSCLKQNRPDRSYKDTLLISAYDALRISFIVQFHIRERIKGFISDAC